MTSADTPLPTLIYARMSQDPENNETGVSRQLSLELDLIKTAAGEQLLTSIPGSPKNPKDPAGDRWPPGCLVDNDISSAEIDGKVKDRPEFERLMTLIEAGQVKVVRAQNQARLFRNRRDTGRIIEIGARRGVRLKFLKGSEIDLGDKMGRAMADFMAIFDRMYVEQVQEGQRVASEYQARQGAYHGGRPFGYQRVGAERGHGEKRTLVPYEPEAAIVREAARRVIDGESLYAICQDLDARGIRTATGKTWRQVGTGSLRAILTAYRNIGVRAHEPGSKRRHTAAAMQHKGSWEPILDEGTFDEAREILTSPDRKTSPGPARKYLLPGFIMCGKCGAAMKSESLHRPDGQGGWIKMFPRYACDTQHAGGCGGVTRKMADVDRVVVQRVFHWLEDNGLFDAAMQSAETEDVRALRQRLRELDRQMGKFDDLLADETWTKAQYDRQVRRKESEIAAVRADLGRCLGTRRMEDITERGARFVSQWQQWEADGPPGLSRRRYVVETLIDRVVVHPVGKGRVNDRLVQVFPAAWADRLGDRKAEVLPLPVPAAISGPDQVREWLAAHPGEWFTRTGIAEALGFTANNCHKYLQKLERDGAISRAWGQVRTDEGRPAFTYTISGAREGAA